MNMPCPGKLSLVLGLGLSVALILHLGCQEAKPPLSPKAVTFTKEIQSLINRIVPPLVEPVGRKEMPVVQKELIRVFSICGKECEGVFYNVFILDRDGVLTAVYPPTEVKRFQFTNYKMVRKALDEKKPNQSILYMPDGTATYVICLPLLRAGEVTGILALGFDGEALQQKRGISTKEFLALTFKAPDTAVPEEN
ncbi:MAG: hypothetical protein ACUVXF_09205 [Desulfobaccales bacterium]